MKNLICATFEMKYKGKMFTVTFEPNGELCEYDVTVSVDRFEILSGACKMHTISPAGALNQIKSAIKKLKP